MTDKTTMTLSVPDGKGGMITTGPFTQKDLKNVIKKIKKGPPMKHDPDFAEQADKAYRVTADELRSFIERFERLEAEKNEFAVWADSPPQWNDSEAKRELELMLADALYRWAEKHDAWQQFRALT